MRQTWLVPLLMLGTFVLGVAIKKADTSPRTAQPVIVASFNRRGITQGIPTTTLFTPAVTGVYRASLYLAMTTPTGQGNTWPLYLTWTDDVGPESDVLGQVFDTAIPPMDYEYNEALNGAAAPFVFEAIAGQPVAFQLVQPPSPSGTCALALTVERLQ